MSEIVISLKNVSKCYKRYARPITRLKELLLPGKTKADEFWALRNIELEVPRGHTLGIVGQNGSGKSTLLQIIVGTLAPTTGQVEVKGRISALLELGSGFNPEFTGQENVFLNGRILGFSKQEVEAKYDEIAAFADIGEFINQPVKTYSSGMFVRLAFAVATIFEPEILVVDEALSVGDEAFQRKCFSRIESIHKKGGTILFVSHSASSVVQLCDSAILIDRGELLLSGSPKLVVSKYHKIIYAPADKLAVIRQEIRAQNCQATVNSGEIVLTNGVSKNHSNSNRGQLDEFYDPGMISKSIISYISQGAKIETPHITTPAGKIVNVLVRGSEYIYTYSVKFTEAAYRVRFGMLVKTVSGFELGGAASHTLNDALEWVERGKVVQVEFKFRCLLQPGVYFLNAGVLGITDAVEVFLHRYIDVVMFRVQAEESMLATGCVDFCIEPHISFCEPTDRIKQQSSV